MIELPTIAMGNQLPQIIHQTYPCEARLPIELQENIRKTRILNPSWEYRFYDDAAIESNILKNYGLGILQVYLKIRSSYGAARADFFRYLLLYAEGGVYLDIKSAVTRPLDDFIALDDFCVLSKWDNRPDGTHPGWGLHRELESIAWGEYQQWVIITRAGHPFLRAVIERVINNIVHYNVLKDGVGRRGVLKLSGPIAYTLAIEDIKHLHPFRELDNALETGIEYNIYKTPGQRWDHKAIGLKDYAGLSTSITYPRTFNAYWQAAFYYLKKRIKKLRKA